MAKSSRPYRKGKRAEMEEETRRRITEAAVKLHGSVGPANTKLTEVARLAGVSRMTVYKHFPTDADLFAACSTHWAARNPLPDASAWAAIENPTERLVHALTELYRWYGSKRDMWSNVLRDASTMPAVAGVMDRAWRPFVEQMIDELAKGWSPGRKDRDALEPMLRVAVDFNTWRTLTESGVSQDRAAQLAADMVIGAVRVTAD